MKVKSSSLDGIITEIAAEVELAKPILRYKALTRAAHNMIYDRGLTHP